MKTKLAILYCYHQIPRQRLVESHFAALQRDNPGVPVIPLSFNGPEYIPGTIVTDKLESVWLGAWKKEYGPDWREKDQHFWKWASYDRAVIFRYLRSPLRVAAERYVIAEWDVLSQGMSFKEYFGSLWDADAVSSSLLFPHTHPNWIWWDPDARKNLGDENLRGVIPVCGTLLSERAVEILVREEVPSCLQGVFSELFFPTLLHLHGIETKVLTERKGMIITYGDKPCYAPGKRGIFHPITDH